MEVVRHCISTAFGVQGDGHRLDASDVELARRLIGHLTVRFCGQLLLCAAVLRCIPGESTSILVGLWTRSFSSRAKSLITTSACGW